jgi:hypothetical protein
MTEPEYLYWGDPWPSGVCDEASQSNTYPLGERCLLCEEKIEEGQSGTYVSTMDADPLVGLRYAATEPVHKECSLRSVLGGIGHHVKHDYWCKVRGDPNAGLTYRESALLVWALIVDEEWNAGMTRVARHEP